MGNLLKIKCIDARVNVHDLALTSVPFTLTTVQVANLALTHTKRITVQRFSSVHVDMVWLNRSLIPVGRRGIISSFT